MNRTELMNRIRQNRYGDPAGPTGPLMDTGLTEKDLDFLDQLGVLFVNPDPPDVLHEPSPAEVIETGAMRPILLADPGIAVEVPESGGDDDDSNADERRDVENEETRETLGRVCAMMELEGISTLEVEYSGSGDSGQCDGVAGLDDANGAVPTSAALETLAEEFLWELVELFHAGWENNNGGSGTLRVSRNPNRAIWDHGDTVEETQYNYYRVGEVQNG